MTRSTCRAPLPGGMNISTWSVKTMRPTLSLFFDGGKGEKSADLGSELILGLLDGPEASRSTEVHQEHDRELTLFAEFLDERLAGPGRDVPVDGADIVPRLVFPHLVELHPAPLEYALVFSGQDVVHDLGGDRSGW